MTVKERFRKIRTEIMNSDSRAEAKRKVFGYDTQMRSEGIADSDRKNVWAHVLESLNDMVDIPGKGNLARVAINAIQEMANVDFDEYSAGDYTLRVYNQPAVNDPKIPFGDIFTVVVVILDSDQNAVDQVAGIGNTIEDARKDGIERAEERVDDYDD